MAANRQGHNMECGLVADLVKTTLRCDQLRGVSEMLGVLARHVGADGGVLWERVDPPAGGSPRFYTLGHWTVDGTMLAVPDLPTESTAGRTVRMGTLQVYSLQGAAELFPAEYKHFQANQIWSQPLFFRDDTAGVLDIIWRTPGEHRESRRQFEEASALVPDLYESITDHVSHRLLSRLNEVLQGAARQAAASPDRRDWEKPVFEEITGLLCETFQCVEVSLFLEDRLARPGVFSLAATTRRDFVKQTEYRAGEQDLTGWILRHKRSVRIPDLGRFQSDREWIAAEYEGLEWTDWLDVESAVRRTLGAGPADPTPPATFIAAPIVVGDSVLGAVRCCTAVQSPHYYSKREESLLGLAAAQIGRFWANALTTREMALENRTWRNLAHKLISLNRFAHDEFRRPEPDEKKILAEGLRVTRDVIDGAEMLDVRLLDDRTQELYFAETLGDVWQQGTPVEVKERLALRYSVSGDDRSADVHVFNTQSVMHLEDVENYAHYRKPWEGVQRMICAPISSANVRFGVLGICGIGERPFRPDSAIIAELIGEQLGLYHFLALTIREQTATYEDFRHQWQSPITQARIRIRQVLESLAPGPQVTQQALAVRGLLNKAKRVASSISLFAKLSRGRAYRTKLVALRRDDLVRSLIEAAMDNRLLAQQPGMNFNVEAQTFDVLDKWEVQADVDLLEQALNNVLDNAFKYSYSYTTIRLYGGLTSDGRFHISIANKGISLNAEDAARVVERGWRSREAIWTTGEGTGIGLWIVDHIMRVHQGEFRLVPTNDGRVTEARLLFPARERQQQQP